MSTSLTPDCESPALVQMLENDSKIMFGVLCCYYCALTWTIFDHVLTFSDEVMYVWKRPMRAGSILFYIMRYLGIASLLAGMAMLLWPEEMELRDVDIQSCSRTTVVPLGLAGDVEYIIFVVAPGLQFPIFWVVEVALQTRIFALYANIRLAIFNGFLFITEIAAMVGLWWYALSANFSPEAALRWRLRADATVYWLPAIVFDLWLAILAFRKLRPQVLKHDLLTVIVNDSIRYFFMIAIIMVVHVVASFKSSGSYVVPFVIAGQTIGGSRLVLHLRWAYFRSYESDSISGPDITFAARTSGVPIAQSRFADETFYVQENLGDDDFLDEIL